MAAVAEPIRVLHVDDEEDLVELSSTFIQREHEDIIVHGETDPRACRSRVKSNSLGVDCIISDYEMPHLNGLELLEMVRSADPQFPFILFTRKGSEEIAAEAISKGVSDYMQKETGTDQYAVLAKRVKQIVRGIRTERALRNSEERYRALVEQCIAGIYLIQRGEFAYVNPRLADIFGYTQGEVLQIAPVELVAERDVPRVEENLRKRLEGEVDTIKYRFTGRHKDGGELDILVQGRAIEFDGSPGVAGVLFDVDNLY